MSQQYQQQPASQQSVQRFEESAPMEVSQAVMQIEAFETEAEWAKTSALRGGDSYAAQELEDLVELLHLQKKLFVRQSWHAPTVGQCTIEAIQHGSQELLQSEIPEVQQIARDAQLLVQAIQGASSGMGATMGGHVGMASQQ